MSKKDNLENLLAKKATLEKELNFVNKQIINKMQKIPIDNLNIEEWIKNILAKNGVISIGDLMSLIQDKRRYHNMEGLARKGRERIESALSEIAIY